MENLKEELQTSSSNVTKREQLEKKVTQSHIRKDLYSKRILKQALSHLLQRKSKRKGRVIRECCSHSDSTTAKVDPQVKLRCRQLPNVVEELRKAIIRQDWDAATTLVMILCHPGLKYYSTIIIRVCFILLFNHPSSNLTLVKNFIRLTTDYVLEEDVNKFIRIIFVLRKALLQPLELGKYRRTTGDYKVIRDFEFEML